MRLWPRRQPPHPTDSSRSCLCPCRRWVEVWPYRRHARFQVIARYVTECLDGGNVQHHGWHLPTADRGMLNGDRLSGDPPCRLDHLVDGHGLPGTEDEGAGMAGPPGIEEALDHVVHVHDVADHRPVTAYLHALAFAGRAHEPRDEAVLLRHAGSVDIGEAQGGPRD